MSESVLNDYVLAARSKAIEYEAQIEPIQRKRLGQFFTGLSLSRLLASLSLRNNTRTVIDPMAGHGDLLDAVLDVASIRQTSLYQVDGIEIDAKAASICRDRVSAWNSLGKIEKWAITANNAFNPKVIAGLENEGYDLVITNPPYVRYQTFSGTNVDMNQCNAKDIRSSLLEIAKMRAPSVERDIWMTLINGYSGLADLSVPSWLLAALLVRSDGVLALVAPATWRSRNYASVLRYLLCRCFEIEVVVADKQPGWFSEALVRTHLIIAKRKKPNESIKPQYGYPSGGCFTAWVEIESSASARGSLVGSRFDGIHPEEEFTTWLDNDKITDNSNQRKGIAVKYISVADEVEAVMAEVRNTSWIRRLELIGSDVPLFDSPTAMSLVHLIPQLLRSIIPFSSDLNITTLEQSGIKVGQGLRTGCNGFFYVSLLEYVNENEARIRASKILGSIEITVPLIALKSVIRDQADIKALSNADSKYQGYVLDLREFVLPEDYTTIDVARSIYMNEGKTIPRIMPPSLAEFVKQAARTIYDPTTGKYIPELSAVRTNARDTDLTLGKTPRFWYMLPDFSRRHLPDAFLPRVNHSLPWVVANTDPPMLIDANFCTIWGDRTDWPKHAIVAILNSCWSQACMEALGTSLGGGALKLEATHLRKLPIPKLSDNEIEHLDGLGRRLIIDSETMNATGKIDTLVTNAVMNRDRLGEKVDHIINELRQLARRLKRERERG